MDEFIKKHRSDDVASLALALSGRKDVDAVRVLQQIDGWQRLSRKVPRWAAVDGLEYPVRLSVEQCSGEAAARYKAALVARLIAEAGEHEAMADLTGGFGVDFSFLAPLFERAVYVERDAELCRIARHNFPLLGLTNHEILEGNGTQLLKDLPPLSFIMLDPARRDAAGRKTVLLEDCEPNLAELLPNLLEKAPLVLAKLSPMLDLGKALAELRHVSEAHIVAEGGECKELLLVLLRTAVAADGALADSKSPVIHCVNDGNRFSFTAEEERAAAPAFADDISGWLYEPNAAVMKAGGFKAVCVRFGLRKLHPNSHLYVAQRHIADFPGRVLKICRTAGFSKRELRDVAALGRANIAVRNFPATVAQLRTRLKLKEGGEDYLFATTAADGRHLLIICRRDEATTSS